MASFLCLPSRLHAPISSLPLRRNAIGSLDQQAYVHDTSQKFSQANEHPTLRDGRQSNLADMEGKRHEDLPEDVRKHNEEMEHRYDRAYNHIADEGKVGKVFEQK